MCVALLDFPLVIANANFILVILGVKGFLPKLFALCVVDSRGLFHPARLVMEPLSDYRNSCLHATMCSIAIERGSAFVIPC